MCARVVCVCSIWTDVKLLIGFHYFAGGLEPICLSSPTKLWHFGGWVVWSTTCTCKTQFELLTKLLHCVVSTLHGCHNLYCMHQNLPQIFAETISPTVLWFFDIFSPRSCRRWTMGHFGKQSPKHYLGFQHAGHHSMDSGFNYVWQYRMPYIVFEKYLMRLFYSSNNLDWFACFRIQFLPDHIMIHSCLVWFPWWLRHGAMEPLEATLFRWVLTDLNSEFTHFNLVIR